MDRRSRALDSVSRDEMSLGHVEEEMNMFPSDQDMEGKFSSIQDTSSSHTLYDGGGIDNIAATMTVLNTVNAGKTAEVFRLEGLLPIRIQQKNPEQENIPVDWTGINFDQRLVIVEDGFLRWYEDAGGLVCLGSGCLNGRVSLILPDVRLAAALGGSPYLSLEMITITGKTIVQLAPAAFKLWQVALDAHAERGTSQLPNLPAAALEVPTPLLSTCPLRQHVTLTIPLTSNDYDIQSLLGSPTRNSLATSTSIGVDISLEDDAREVLAMALSSMNPPLNRLSTLDETATTALLNGLLAAQWQLGKSLAATARATDKENFRLRLVCRALENRVASAEKHSTNLAVQLETLDTLVQELASYEDLGDGSKTDHNTHKLQISPTQKLNETPPLRSSVSPSGTAAWGSSSGGGAVAKWGDGEELGVTNNGTLVKGDSPRGWSPQRLDVLAQSAEHNSINWRSKYKEAIAERDTARAEVDEVRSELSRLRRSSRSVVAADKLRRENASLRSSAARLRDEIVALQAQISAIQAAAVSTVQRLQAESLSSSPDQSPGIAAAAATAKLAAEYVASNQLSGYRTRSRSPPHNFSRMSGGDVGSVCDEQEDFDYGWMSRHVHADSTSSTAFPARSHSPVNTNSSTAAIAAAAAASAMLVNRNWPRQHFESLLGSRLYGNLLSAGPPGEGVTLSSCTVDGGGGHLRNALHAIQWPTVEDRLISALYSAYTSQSLVPDSNTSNPVTRATGPKLGAPVNTATNSTSNSAPGRNGMTLTRFLRFTRDIGVTAADDVRTAAPTTAASISNLPTTNANMQALSNSERLIYGELSMIFSSAARIETRDQRRRVPTFKVKSATADAVNPVAFIAKAQAGGGQRSYVAGAVSTTAELSLLQFRAALELLGERLYCRRITPGNVNDSSTDRRSQLRMGLELLWLRVLLPHCVAADLLPWSVVYISQFASALWPALSWDNSAAAAVLGPDGEAVTATAAALVTALPSLVARFYFYASEENVALANNRDPSVLLEAALDRRLPFRQASRLVRDARLVPFHTTETFVYSIFKEVRSLRISDTDSAAALAAALAAVSEATHGSTATNPDIINAASAAVSALEFPPLLLPPVVVSTLTEVVEQHAMQQPLWPSIISGGAPKRGGVPASAATESLSLPEFIFFVGGLAMQVSASESCEAARFGTLLDVFEQNPL